MQAATLRRLVLVSIIVGLAGLLATLYTTVWAQPGQQGSVTIPGEVGPGVVWGYVYDDLNRSGERDAGEPGISGAFVSFASGQFEATTGEDGSYGFFDMATGQHIFHASVPSGFVLLPPNEVEITVVDEQPIRLDFRAFEPGPPAAPGTKPTVSPGNGTATVTWPAPDDGGAPITGYTITVKQGESTVLTVEVGNVQTATVSGLTNGTAYTFTVFATNIAGNGPPSAASDPVTPFGLPGAPGKPQVDVEIARQVRVVTWDAPADDGGSPITAYLLSLFQGNGTFVASEEVSGIGLFGFDLLNAGQDYKVSVQAKSARGLGAPSPFSETLTVGDVPGAPIGLTASNIQQTTLDLSWLAPSDTGGRTITEYDVQRAIGAGAFTSIGMSTGSPPATAFTDATATAATTYRYKVIAENEFGPGTTPSDVLTVTTLAGPPTPPLNLTASTVGRGSGEVFLDWDAPASDGGLAINQYEIQADASSGFTQVGLVGGGTTEFVVTGQQNGVSTDYRVRASNDQAGFGDFSNTATATPSAAPGKPRFVTATPGDGELTVSWVPPADNGGFPITGFTVTVYENDSSVQTQAAAAGDRSATVSTNVNNGTTYTASVFATNGATPPKDGPKSDMSNPVTPAGAPTAPQNLTVTPGTNSVSVTWETPASNGGSPITGYNVDVYKDGVYQDITVQAAPNSRSATVRGLENGTIYTIRMIAFTAVADSPFEISGNVTPQTAPDAPSVAPVTSPTNADNVVLTITAATASVDATDTAKIQATTRTSRDGVDPVVDTFDLAPGQTATLTVALLSNENHGVEVRALSAGATPLSSEAVFVSITQDSTDPAAPGLSFEPGFSSPTNLTTTRLVLVAPADAASTSIFREGTTNAVFTTTLPGISQPVLQLPTDGTATFTAVTTDAAGNESAASTAVVVVRDRQKPDQPTVDPIPAADTNDIEPTLNITAEDGSTVTITGGAETVTRVAGAAAFGVDYRLKPNQLNIIEITAKDAAGNTSDKTIVTTTHDDLKPGLTVSPAPALTKETAVPFTVTAEAGSTISVAGGTATDLTATGANQTMTVTLAGDGDKTLTFTATDAAGNTTDVIRKTTLDTTAPADPTVVDPASPTSVKNAQLQVTGEAGATIIVTVSSNPTATHEFAATGVQQTLEFPLFLDTTNTVTVKQRDAAGNVSSPGVTKTIVSDVTGPAAPTVTVRDPGTGNEITGPTKLAKVALLIQPGSAVKSVKVNGAVVQTISPAADRQVASLQTLTANAANEYSVTVVDDADNESGATKVTVVSDQTAPGAPTVSQPTTPTRDTTVSFDVDTEPNATVRVFVGTLERGDGVEADANGDATVEVTLDRDKATKFDFLSLDAAGNRSAQVSRTMTNDSTPPFLLVTYLDVDVTKDTNFTVNVITEAGATVTVTGGAETVTAAGTGGFQDITIALNTGAAVVNTLVFTAKDALGNESDPVTVSITQDNMAPTLLEGQVSTPDSPTTAPSVTLTVSGITKDDTVTVTGGAAGALTQTAGSDAATLTFNVELERSKNHTVLVTVTDPAGNVSTPAIERQVERTRPTTQISGKIIADDIATAVVVLIRSDDSTTSEPVNPNNGRFEFKGLDLNTDYEIQLLVSGSGPWYYKAGQTAEGTNVTLTAGDASSLDTGASGRGGINLSVTPPPTITGVAGGGDNDATHTITVTGTNLDGATKVFLSSGTTQKELSVDSSNPVTVTATVPIGTAANLYNVTVVTPAGTSAPSADQVNITQALAQPEVTELDRAIVAQGAATSIEARGQNLGDIGRFMIFQQGLTATQVGGVRQVETGGSPTAFSFTVPATLAQGVYFITFGDSPQGLADGPTSPFFAVEAGTAPSATPTRETNFIAFVNFLTPTTEHLPVGIAAEIVLSNEGEEDRPNAAIVTVNIPEGTLLTDDSGFQFEGDLFAPRNLDVPEGFTDANTVVIQAGSADQRVNFSIPVVMEVKVVAALGTVPTVFLTTAAGEYEFAGITGTRDGIDFAPGGTLLSLTNVGGGSFEYVIGVLIEHLSNYVATTDVLVPPTAPSAPLIVDAEGGNTQATVTWDAPDSTGGEDITGYRVVAILNGSGSGQPSANVDENTFTATVTGLVNGSAYTFRVFASNSVGQGDASEDSAEVTPATTPGVPGTIISAIGDSESLVTWTAPEVSPGVPDDGGSAITGYRITASPADIDPVTVGAVLSATIGGLTNSTAYTFTIEALNAEGFGTGATSLSSVTPYPADEPAGQPTGVDAIAGNGAAEVNWQAPSKIGGSTILTYTVEAFAGGVASGQSVTVDAPALSAQVEGLTNGTAYTFKVVATNGGGDGPTGESAAVTPLGVPEPPINVLAVAGEEQATVTWDEPGSDGGSAITGYTITSTPASVTKNVGATTLTVTFTELTGDTVYTFSVLATNAEGDGLAAESDPVTVTAPVGTPTPAPTKTPTPRPTLTPTPEPTGPTPTPSKPDVAVTAEPGGDVVVIDADVDTEQTSGDTIVTIKIDAGTVASARRVLVYSPTTVDDTKDTVPDLPAGTSYGATIFRINLVEPDGTVTVGERLAKPITLTVKYSDADLAAANNNPLNMRIFVYREGEGWVGLDTIVNIANKTLTTQVSRFSLFAILGAEPVPTPTTVPVNPTATFIPPSVGDANLGSGMMMAFLALAVAFIATGAYYLRPRRKEQD